MQFYQELNEIVTGAGKVGLENRLRYNTFVKSKANLYLTAEQEIGKYLQKQLTDLLPEAGFICDASREELEAKTGGKESLSGENVWVVNPLDGLNNYPFGPWCLSVGLLQREKESYRPVLGSVYVPNFRELFFTDGKESYVYYASENKTEKAGKNMKTSAVMARDDIKCTYSYGKFDTMKGYSTAFNLVSVAFGDAIATIVNGYIWDIAAGMAIGMGNNSYLYEQGTKRRIEYFDTESFSWQEDEEWRLKRDYFFCNSKNKNKVFSNVRSKIIPFPKA